MGKAAGRDIANGHTLMQDRLIIGHVDPLQLQGQGHQALARLFARLGGRFADKLFVPIYEPIQPGFSGGKIRSEIQAPSAPAFFKPHRHQSPRAIPAQALIGPSQLHRFGQAAQILRFAVNFIAQFTRKTDPGQDHRNARHIGHFGVAKGETCGADILAGQFGQYRTGFWTAECQTVPVLADIAIMHALGQITHEPTPVRFLHRAGPEEHEMLRPITGHGQIAVKPALFGQHRRQSHPARFRDKPR